MPYRVVRMYADQMPATIAEWKLNLVEVLMVANAAKKYERDSIIHEWQRIAQKDISVEKSHVNAIPTGLGA